MAIDLNTKDGRDKFLKDNLANLLDGLNDTYGPLIVDELLKRISYTIEEFNEEMKNAFNILKEREIQKIEAYKKIQYINKQDDESKNEWEEKLENIESDNK